MPLELRTTKKRSRAHQEARLAARQQKQRRGEIVDDTVASGAVQGARDRARTRAQRDTVEALAQAVEVAMEGNCDDWRDRSIPYEQLKNEIDPDCAEEMALLAAALRKGTDLETFKAKVARSRRLVVRDNARRAAGAEEKRADGLSATYTRQRINGAGQLKVQKRKVSLTGPQVLAKEERTAQLRALPPRKKPTFATQTSAPGNNPLLKFQGTAKLRGRDRRGKRSRAEELAEQAQAAQRKSWVRGKGQAGSYMVEIPRSLWSGRELAKMGFRPKDKPKRCFSFSGPTAEDDARAFDKELKEWFEKRVGPPPQK